MLVLVIMIIIILVEVKLNIKDLISEFGGLTQMSKILNVPVSTIQSWGNKNKIPAWRIQVVVESARKHNIYLPNDFYQTGEDN